MHLFCITPTHLITLATSVFACSFASRMINLGALLALFVYLLFGVVDPMPEWVGIPNSSPWHIKLQLTTVSHAWSLVVVFLTTMDVLSSSNLRRFASAFCLSAIGIGVASDLFHTYVWLEVAMFALMGFGWGAEALREYWGLQTFAAFLILIGTVLQYQVVGTLTMPDALEPSSALYLWMIGWLVKSGLGFWLLRGYRAIREQDLFYVVSLSTKLGVLVLYKLPDIPDWIKYLGLLQYVVGGLIAYSASDLRTFVGAHAMAQCGSMLSALQHGLSFEYYFILHVLADALFIELIVSEQATLYDDGLSVWWIVALVCVAGIPPSAVYFLKLQMLGRAWWLAFAGAGTLAYCLQVAPRIVTNPRSQALLVACLLTQGVVACTWFGVNDIEICTHG
jgi:formate hydrogenlyase subunit 3/multisubunit Na+/H+ antiporter MnhD subunit